MEGREGTEGRAASLEDKERWAVSLGPSLRRGAGR